MRTEEVWNPATAKVFDQLLKHPLTDKGVEQFLKDWEKVPVIK